MSDHIALERLHDYADGLLDPPASAAVRVHLDACDACRTELSSIRALLEDLSQLDREIQPPRDLRPGIWQAVDALEVKSAVEAGSDGGVVPFRRPLHERSIASLRWPLAAAALVLVAVTAGITTRLMRRAAVEIAMDSPAAHAFATAAHYEQATSDLERLVREQRDILAPETVRILETNLQVIDRALAESREALEADPGNVALSGMLLATYAKKLDLLRNATLVQAGI
jgi:Putative zinc-finger